MKKPYVIPTAEPFVYVPKAPAGKKTSRAPKQEEAADRKSSPTACEGGQAVTASNG